ncbi:MAG: glycerol-3-phosphate 1-O-acyltransferase PlsY [Clostridiales bacterium]|nr:glycerol-3-phosphate 1-O-acyltransferase PlsY [Clostridiales bacterium]
MSNNIIFYCIALVIGYVIGSFSPAVLLSRKVANIDIRQKGSKNAGSTNVFRVLGAKWGLINFVFDLLKGAVPTLIALLVFRNIGDGFNGYHGAVIIASGVLLGHVFPVFSHFKGGKGVASTTGVFLVLFPIPLLIIFVIAVVIILTTRYVSVASVLSFIIISISVWIIPGLMKVNLPVQIFTTAASVLILILHRENIVRLLKGNENKLNF